jgi:hypothetical protein
MMAIGFKGGVAIANTANINGTVISTILQILHLQTKTAELL